MGAQGPDLCPQIDRPPSRNAPMLTKKLTDTAIRKAKHGEKSMKLSDGGGL